MPIVLAMAPLLIAAAKPTSDGTPQQRPAISFELFFHDLNRQGQWSRFMDKTWIWQPRGVEPDWRPFSRGSWVVTELGWYWLSDYPWGYVTSHYGRWENWYGIGWFWLPDSVWSSAWVYWAQGEKGIAWHLLQQSGTGILPVLNPSSGGWTVASWPDLESLLLPRPGLSKQPGGANVLEAIVVSNTSVVAAHQSLPAQDWKITKPKKQDNMAHNPGPDRALIEAKTGRRLRPCRVLHTRRRREILLVGRDESVLVTFRPIIKENAGEIQVLITRKAEQYRKIRERRAGAALELR
ncbi:hypothetical protein AMJ85_11050 [candidate division BRC1 bacterium SM23_51]|nr:MAG: hypothetical protein AMJ85_11050 [candidate division BRC1 bacterium SM23_51]